MVLGRLGAVTAVTGIVTFGIVGMAAPADARPLPKALTWESGDAFSVRPQLIVYTGDAAGLIGRHPGTKKGKIIWSSWTAKAAKGRGSVWLNNCNPSCAEGTYIRYRGRVSLTRPRKGHFTRLSISVPGMRKDTRTLQRSANYYVWTPSR